MPYPSFAPGCGAQPATPLGPTGAPTTGVDGDAFPVPSGLPLNTDMSNAFDIPGDYVVSCIGTRNTGTG